MQLSIETFYVTSNKISHERKKRKKRNSFLDNVKLDDEKIRRPLMTKKHLYTKSEGTYTYIKFLRGEKLNLMPPRFFLFFFSPRRNNLSYAVSLAILFPRAGYDVLRS